MTDGAALGILATATGALAFGTVAAQRRAGARGLFAAGVGFTVVFLAIFLWRDHASSEPYAAAVLVFPTVTAAVGVAWLRRKHRATFTTGVLCWAAAVFTYFQTASILHQF